MEGSQSLAPQYRSCRRRELGRRSVHLEIQCGSLSQFTKPGPCRGFMRLGKSLTVKISNQLSLHQAQAQTETYRLLCLACAQPWCSPGQPHGCPVDSLSPFSGCCEPVTSFIILDSSRLWLYLRGLPASSLDLSLASCCFLIALCSLLPQGLFTGYS